MPALPTRDVGRSALQGNGGEGCGVGAFAETTILVGIVGVGGTVGVIHILTAGRGEKGGVGLLIGAAVVVLGIDTAAAVPGVVIRITI